LRLKSLSFLNFTPTEKTKMTKIENRSSTELIDPKVVDVTADIYARYIGLTGGLKRMIEISGAKPGTLRNWTNEKPNLFHIVALGCLAHELGFSLKPEELKRIAKILDEEIS